MMSNLYDAFVIDGVPMSPVQQTACAASRPPTRGVGIALFEDIKPGSRLDGARPRRVATYRSVDALERAIVRYGERVLKVKR